MSDKGTKSDIGETVPTDKTKESFNSFVDDVINEHELPEGGSAQDDGISTLGLKKSGPKELNIESDDDGNVSVTDGEEAEEEAPEEEETQGEAENEEEEEVVPKSELEKTKEAMQKRIDSLTAKLKTIQEAAPKEPQSQEEKLERLSPDELKVLIEQTEDARDEALLEQNKDKLQQLRKLHRNAVKALQEAPHRTYNRQVENLKPILESVADLDPNVKQGKGELWNLASAIYQRYSSLQRSETGMAEAMVLAAERFQEIKLSASGKQKLVKASQQVQALKKKTALEGKSRIQTTNKESKEKLRNRAVNGTYYDKLDFVASLIPENFFER
jgi:hypothetical protein